MTRSSTVWTLLVSLALLLPGLGFSQDAPLGADAPAATGTEPYVPPVLRQPEISLVDALRVTLEHAPEILLQEESTRFSLGAYTEQQGLFDTVLLGDFNAEYGDRFLRQSQIATEQKTRDDEQKMVNELQGQVDQLVAAQNDLDFLRGNPSGPDVLDPNAFDPNDPGSIPVNDITGRPVLENFEDVRGQFYVINALINEHRNDADPTLLNELIAQREGALNAFGDDLSKQLNGEDGLNSRLTREQQKLANLGDTPTKEEGFSVSVNLQAAFSFRSGFKLTPFFESTFSGSRFVGKPRTSDCFVEVDGVDVPQECGGQGAEDLYEHHIGLKFTVPLLRGRGREEVAAFEKSAEINYEASREALRHSATSAVLSTALAYWNLATVQAQLAVLQESSQRQVRLVDMSQALVDAQELPGAELARARARSTTVLGQLADSQRSLAQARVALATAMGAAVEDLGGAPLASTAFPNVGSDVSDSDLQGLLSGIGERRYDLHSAELLSDSGGVLARAAELALRSRLDLSAEISGQSLGEKKLSDSIDRLTANYVLGLSYEKPLGNRERKGRLIQRQASAAQDKIRAADLERRIKANVVDLAASLKQAAESVRQAEQAVSFFRQSVDGELEKFRAGQSSLIDTLLTEEQLTGAQISLLQARSQYAQLLARLRFESGTLVTQQDDGSSAVDGTALLAPPAGGSVEGGR